MKVTTYPDDRMLYIELVEGATSEESEEISPGIVVDYDAAERPIGIELDIDSIGGALPRGGKRR